MPSEADERADEAKDDLSDAKTTAAQADHQAADQHEADAAREENS